MHVILPSVQKQHSVTKKIRSGIPTTCFISFFSLDHTYVRSSQKNHRIFAAGIFGNVRNQFQQTLVEGKLRRVEDGDGDIANPEEVMSQTPRRDSRSGNSWQW